MDACNGYETFIKQKKAKPDVCYWMNKLLENDAMNFTKSINSWACINSSIEESTLSDRKLNLLPQDKFIQENITNEDILIVSVGGNDIALKPSISTIFHMGKLIYWDADYVNSMSFRYLVDMFKNQVERYIRKLILINNPKLIIVNTIYFPCLYGSSWADRTLNLMNY